MYAETVAKKEQTTAGFPAKLPVTYRISFRAVRAPGVTATLSSPEAAARFARDAKLFPDDGRERAWVAMLNRQNRVIAIWEASVGALDTTLLGPREIYGAALRVLGTAAILVFHNHPSGDPRPSSDDIATTQRLAKAGDLLEVPLLDHLILGDGEGAAWVSMHRLGHVSR